LTGWLAVLVVWVALPGGERWEDLVTRISPTEEACAVVLAEEAHRALDAGAKSVSGSCVEMSPQSGS
jgi:hypothetical protein